MNYPMMLSILIQILRVVALFLLPALGIALFQGETQAAVGFGVAILAMLLPGLLKLWIKPKRKNLYAREGFVLVAGGWVLVSLMGAIPFYVSGAIPRFVDAFFESASGFTTTGASILESVATLPMSLGYWRSFTNWLGGMGVLVFLLAVLPLGRSEGYSIHLMRAETPGPQVGKMVPKTQSTAVILYGIYIGMTLIQFVLLLFGDVSPFEALTISFATAGTGGFTISDQSLMQCSTYTQGVAAVFMFLFGVSFNVYYLLLFRGSKRGIFNEELRLYICVVLISTLLIFWNVFPLYDGLATAAHHSFFQVVSMITTTSFATVDLEFWPQFAKTLLLLLMVCGACASSTAGGIKLARVAILFKHIKNTLIRLVRPNTVKMVHMDGIAVDNSAVQGVLAFMICFLLLSAGSMLLISIDGLSMESNLTAVLACISNTGPGYAQVGHAANYAQYSDLSKIVLIVNMLFGRLEIFPVLMLFAPSTWKRG